MSLLSGIGLMELKYRKDLPSGLQCKKNLLNHCIYLFVIFLVNLRPKNLLRMKTKQTLFVWEWTMKIGIISQVTIATKESLPSAKPIS